MFTFVVKFKQLKGVLCVDTTVKKMSENCPLVNISYRLSPGRFNYRKKSTQTVFDDRSVTKTIIYRNSTGGLIDVWTYAQKCERTQWRRYLVFNVECTIFVLLLCMCVIQRATFAVWHACPPKDNSCSTTVHVRYDLRMTMFSTLFKSLTIVLVLGFMVVYWVALHTDKFRQRKLLWRNCS